MGATNRHRFNPRTGLYTYGTINNEEKTVSLIEETGLYGFYLEEAPRIIQSVGASLTIVEDVTGGATWTEQRPGPPDAGSYWLDWRYDSAFVEFHPDDNGKNFLVSYSGKGGLASIDNFPQVINTLITTLQSLSIVGNLSVGNDASITSDLSVTATSTLSGGFKTQGSDLFRIAKVDIGSWDMTSGTAKTVAHGVTLSKIVFIHPVVYNDAGDTQYPLAYGDATANISGRWTVDATNIVMERTAAGTFNTAAFNDTGVNRGYIFIVYTV